MLLQNGYDVSLLGLQPRGTSSTPPSSIGGLNISRSDSRPFSVATSASNYSVDEDDGLTGRAVLAGPASSYVGLPQVHEEEPAYPPQPSPLLGGSQDDPFAAASPYLAAYTGGSTPSLPHHFIANPFGTPPASSSPRRSSFGFGARSPSPSSSSRRSMATHDAEKPLMPSITGAGSAGRASTRGFAATGYEKRAKELEERRASRSSGAGGAGFWAGKGDDEEGKPVWYRRRIVWLLVGLGALLVIGVAVGAGVGLASKKSDSSKSESDANAAAIVSASPSSSPSTGTSDAIAATSSTASSADLPTSVTDASTSMWPTSDWAVQPSSTAAAATPTSEWVDTSTASATDSWADNGNGWSDTAAGAEATSWDDGSGGGWTDTAAADWSSETSWGRMRRMRRRRRARR